MKQKKIIAVTPKTPSSKSRSSSVSSLNSGSRTPGRESAFSHTVDSYMRVVMRSPSKSKTGYECTVENLELALKNTQPDLLKRLHTLNVFYGEGDAAVRKRIQAIFDTNEIYLSEGRKRSVSLIESGGATVLLMDFSKPLTGRDVLDSFENIRYMLEEMLATRVGDNLIAPFQRVNASEWFEKLLLEFSHARTDAYKKAIAGIVANARYDLMSSLNSTLARGTANELCLELKAFIENDTVSYRSGAASQVDTSSWHSFESTESRSPNTSDLMPRELSFSGSLESPHAVGGDFGTGPANIHNEPRPESVEVPATPPPRQTSSPDVSLESPHTSGEDSGRGSPAVLLAEFVEAPATPLPQPLLSGPTSPIFNLPKSPDVLHEKNHAITSSSNFSKLYAKSRTPLPLSSVPAVMAELSLLNDGSEIRASATNAVLIQDLRKYDSVIEKIRTALADETSPTHPKNTGYALHFIETMWPDLLFANHINRHLMAHRLTYSIPGTTQGRFLDHKRCIDKYKAFLCMTVTAFFAIDRSPQELEPIIQVMHDSRTYDHAVEIMEHAYFLFAQTVKSLLIGRNYKALREQSKAVLYATFHIDMSGRE